MDNLCGTPLHLANYYGWDQEVKDWLIAHGADPNIKGGHWRDIGGGKEWVNIDGKVGMQIGHHFPKHGHKL